MKKGFLLSFVVLLMALMMPMQSFSAPTGYKEVKITTKNFGTYFGTKKVKNKDAFGDYSGYTFWLTSKMLKKGYYILFF